MPAGRLSRYARRLALAAAASTALPALAEPPVDRPTGQGKSASALDRALESRASLADRARGRSADALGASATPGASAADRAGGRGLDTAASGPGATNGVTAPGRESSSAFGLGTAAERRGHASPQSGTGRIGRELTAGRSSGRRDAAAAERSLGRRPADGAKSGIRLGWLRNGKSSADGATAGDGATTPGAAGLAHRPEAPRRRGHDPGRILSKADRLLAQRLAQIERMRDEAVANDDDELLRQADKLQALARAQYTQRTTGEKTVGTTMRSFERDRDAEPGPDADAGTDTDGGVTPVSGEADPAQPPAGDTVVE